MDQRIVGRLAMGLLLGGIALPCVAQYPVPPAYSRGFKAEQVFQVGDIDSVNLFNGNLSVTIPIGPAFPTTATGSFGLSLVYNSKAWDMVPLSNGQVRPAPEVHANAGLGWRVSLGDLIQPRLPTGSPQSYTVGNWTYIGSDGADHVFESRYRADDFEGDCSVAACYANDGSYLRLTLDTTQGIERRVVEFPDGTKHYFEATPVIAQSVELIDWRLVAIVGPSGTLAQPDVNVFYECQIAVNPIECPADKIEWRIIDRWRVPGPSEQPAREIRVRFGTVLNGTGRPVVLSVELPQFDPNGSEPPDAGSAKYQFKYEATLVTLPCGNTTTPTTAVVDRLTKVIRPDGVDGGGADASFFSMEYDSVGSCHAKSLLSRLRLPTGGGLSWTYRTVDLPVEGCRGVEWHSKSAGVAQRTVQGASAEALGFASYSAERSLPFLLSRPFFCERGGQMDYGPPEELRTTVVGPDHKTVHYFSVFPGFESPRSGETPFLASEFGLPFTRKKADTAHGLYLSSEVYAHGATTPLRQTYVRYEHDRESCQAVGECQNDNRRQAASETVFADDPPGCKLPSDGPILTGEQACRSVRTERSDFDQFGHYRTTVTTGFDVAAPDVGYTPQATEYTDWNAGRPVPLPESQRWMLNFFSEKSLTGHGQEFRSLYDVDPSTGFVNCSRVLRDTTSGVSGAAVLHPHTGARDITTRYTARTDGTGFVAKEETFGGDRRTTSGGGACGQTSMSPEYVVEHDYQFGVRNRTTAKSGTADFLRTLDLEIDRTGLVRISRDPGGVATTFSYDALGRLTSSTPQGAATMTLSYQLPTTLVPAVANRVSLEIADSSVLEREAWEYDGLGRVTRHEITGPGGVVSGTLTAYDAAGRAWYSSVLASPPPSTVPLLTEPAKGTRVLAFDSLGRPLETEGPDGSRVTMSYVGARISKATRNVWLGSGNPSTGGSPVTATEERDGLGRLRRVTDEKSQVTRYKYDAPGHLVEARLQGAAPRQPRYFKYDGRGLLESEFHPELATLQHEDGGKVAYEYDSRGNPTQRTGARVTLKTTYDKAGRPTQVLLPLGTASGTEKVLRSYKYFGNQDGALEGKLEKAEASNFRYVESQCSDAKVTDTFGYDAAGRPSSRSTQVRLNGALQGSWQQTYQYDGASRLKVLGYPNCDQACTSTARSVETTYSFGRPTVIREPAGQIYASAIEYSGNLALASVLHGNGVKFTQAPDLSGLARPASLQAKKGSAFLWTPETYAYDGSGNIISVGTKTYTYDKLSRLKSASIPSADTNKYQAFEYDRYGNLVQIASGAGPGDTNTDGDVLLPVNKSNNRLATGAALYNNAGSLAGAFGQTFSWDGLEQLAWVATGSETWSHTYDANGERVWSWRDAPGTWSTRLETFALRDLQGSVLRDFKRQHNGSSSTTTVEDYIYRSGSLLATVKPGGVNGIVQHLDVDHLGNVRLATDSNGQSLFSRDYWPYGEVVIPVVPAGEPQPEYTEQMAFTGHERDLGITAPGSTVQKDDLDYMHARYYKPIWGRFLSVDPSPRSIRLGRPQSWNRYSYVIGNPLMYVDPNGEQWFKIDGKWTYFEGQDSMEETTVNDKTGASSTRTVQGRERVVGFDGGQLTLFDRDGTTRSFEAASGRPDTFGRPETQNLKDRGPIPEGSYFFNPGLVQNWSDISAVNKAASVGSVATIPLGAKFGQWPGGPAAWGLQRAELTPGPFTVTHGRGGFFIHGGSVPGSAGCIDLCGRVGDFFSAVGSTPGSLEVDVDYPNYP